MVKSGNLLDCRGNFGKRVRLTRNTRPGASSKFIPDPGHPTPRRWKRLRPPPFLRRRGEWGGRASQSFSSPWGWVRFAPGTPGTCLRRETSAGAFFPAGQTSRRGWCTGASPFFFFSLHACVDMDRHVFVIAPSAPPPPPP